MSKWIVRFSLKVLSWSLGLVGLAALALTAMIAVPLARLPELTSISQSARTVDRSSMPPLSHFSARDGTELAYRHYPARGPSSGKIAILVLIILFIQKRPRGLFALKGRAVEA